MCECCCFGRLSGSFQVKVERSEGGDENGTEGKGREGRCVESKRRKEREVCGEQVWGGLVKRCEVVPRLHAS